MENVSLLLFYFMYQRMRYSSRRSAINRRKRRMFLILQQIKQNLTPRDIQKLASCNLQSNPLDFIERPRELRQGHIVYYFLHFFVYIKIKISKIAASRSHETRLSAQIFDTNSLVHLGKRTNSDLYRLNIRPRRKPPLFRCAA